MDAVAQALADPIRREILRKLREQSLNAGAIADMFPVSRPAISRHLRVLREAGLVRDESAGRERTYELALEALSDLEAFLAELRAPSPWERRLMALETEVHRVKRQREPARQTRVRQNDNKKETA
jgi:DNA-binding transcriptional ArsR family regulator